MFHFGTLNNISNDSVGVWPELIEKLCRLTSCTVKLIVGLGMQMYLLMQ
jgi:hypothetical protein